MTDPTSRWLFPDEAGEPYFLDYETRSRVDLTEAGPWVSAPHADTRLRFRSPSTPLVSAMEAA
jgi:hypothetical protein